MKTHEQNPDQMIRDIYKKTQMPDPVRNRMDDTLDSLVKQEQAIDLSYGRNTHRKRKSYSKSGSHRFFARPGIKKAVIIAAAAALCVGGTVFAASRIYQMNLEKEETYQASIHVTSEEALPEEIEEVEIKVNYLPEGFAVDPDKGIEHYYKHPQIEDAGYVVNEPLLIDEADPLTVSFVKDAEALTINGHDAVYINEQSTPDETWNSGTLYIVFEDVHRILPIWHWGHSSKDELLKIGENVELVPTGNMTASSELRLWSELVAVYEENASDITEKTTASAAEMANTHQVGDTFEIKNLRNNLGEVIPGLQACVTNVQTADDLSLLAQTEQIPDCVKELVGPDGKFMQDTLSHIKLGDGVNTLPEIVRTEQRPVKLIYATLEYTNHSEQTIDDVIVYVSLMRLIQDGDNYKIYEPADDDCDYVESTHVLPSEMIYHDISGDPLQRNHILGLQPGQTVTVHLAWMVYTDDLDKVYLDPSGTSGTQFFDECFETGLIKLDL